MAKQTINIGAAANDGTGDPIRTAFGKVNDNFTEIYTANTGVNTGDQNLSAYATTAAVAAGYQPLDSDLTAIAALTTTAYGRALLSTADAPTLRTAIGLGQTDAPTFLGLALTGTTNQLLKINADYWFGTDTSQVYLYNSGRASPVVSLNNGSNIAMRYDWGLAWTAGASTGSLDLILQRDGAAGILAQRNGTAAQAFRVYHTFPGTTANEWFEIDWKSTANTVQLGTNRGATGTRRAMHFTIDGTIAAFGLSKDGSSSGAWWSIATSGYMLCNVDNFYDIGASGANRPRNIYAGTALISAGYVQVGAGGNQLIFGGRGVISPSQDGVWTFLNAASSDFGRLQLGGTTSAFPAIKRNGTGIDIRLADDSGFAPIKGKLTTDTNYAAGVPSATGYITIYDATGTAYRVPCTV